MIPSSQVLFAGLRYPGIRLSPLPLVRRHVSTLRSSPFLKVSEEIRAAVHAKKPVVALETTIYTHGFPHPQNVALAAELEGIVREGGAVPATIGVLDGVARVGLSSSELERLTDPKSDIKVLKISRRDLTFATGTRLADRTFHGGTTIAGTSVLAHLAGIRIFATGGLGGVHRGAESSMDISADLTELGRTPVTVVSSGCKSFLDIGRTLEYLETEGVAVATFADGREGAVDFPAFWARDSGLKSPMTLRDEREAAAVILAQTGLGLQSGLLFANPIPANAAIPKSEIDVIIAEAVRVADEQGITGKDNTPFILDWILKATEGRSIVANRALIASNVRRGTKVAVELAKFEEAGDDRFAALEHVRVTTGRHLEAQRSPSIKPTSTATIPSTAEVLVAGSVAVDISCDFTPFAGSDAREPKRHTSNPAAIGQSLGGVGYNVAKALHYLDTPNVFCSVIGDDLSGRAVREGMLADGMDPSGLEICPGASTAHYVAINDRDKGLHLAMADMSICEQDDDAEGKFWSSWNHHLGTSGAGWAVLDANLTSRTLRALAGAAKRHGWKTALEPVSTAKAARSVHALQAGNSEAEKGWRLWPDHVFDIVAPNAMELTAMYQRVDSLGGFEDRQWFRIIDALGIPSTGMTNAFKQLMPAHLVDQGVPQQAIKLLPLLPSTITKLGADGVLVTQLLAAGDARLTDGDSAPYVLGRGILDTPSFGEGTRPGPKRSVGGVYMRHFPAAERVGDADVVSVNGVGDTSLGLVIAGLAKHKGRKPLEDLIDLAQRAAALTLKSKESVSPELKRLQQSL